MITLRTLRCLAAVTTLGVLLFASPAPSFAQSDAEKAQADEAFELIGEGKYLQALPLLEKIANSFPDDSEVWAYYGIALMIKSTTINDLKERKPVVEKGVAVLLRAKELGTENARALDLLDTFQNATGEDNFTNDNPEVEKALRKGEEYFGKGEYEDAFIYYRKAHELDPKNYEAILFMGDCYYARKRYQEAVPYFQRAVDLNPKKSTAHLFWADALLYQGKHDEALDKFIDVLILEPFGRTSWDSLRRWGEVTGTEYDPTTVIPPGNEVGGPVSIDPLKLSAANGTNNWMLYTDAVRAWTRKNPGSKRRFSLADEEAAWKVVAKGFEADIAKGSVESPDQSLVNLLVLREDGLLMPYLYFIRGRESFDDDYDVIMAKDGILVRRFVKKHVFHLKEKKDIGY